MIYALVIHGGDGARPDVILMVHHMAGIGEDLAVKRRRIILMNTSKC